MDAKTRYKFAEKHFQDRVEAFASDPDILDLSAEIGQVRALLEQTGPNNPALSASLISTIGKLVLNLQKHQLMSQYLLTHSAVRAIATGLFDAVTRHISHVDGYEDILQKIGQDFQGTLANAKNDPVEVDAVCKGKYLPPESLG